MGTASPRTSWHSARRGTSTSTYRRTATRRARSRGASCARAMPPWLTSGRRHTSSGSRRPHWARAKAS
eukprot:9896375-Lingulodinium_polyedra.AAC.1